MQGKSLADCDWLAVQYARLRIMRVSSWNSAGSPLHCGGTCSILQRPHRAFARCLRVMPEPRMNAFVRARHPAHAEAAAAAPS